MSHRTKKSYTRPREAHQREIVARRRQQRAKAYTLDFGSRTARPAHSFAPAPRWNTYAALEWISHAVWVFDFQRKQILWANHAALELWRAHSLEELCQRNLAADMSASISARLEQYLADFERGTTRFSEQWTLYPRDEPLTLQIVFNAHRLEDGRMAMLCEAMDQSIGTPESLRSVEALLHTSVMITLYDGQWNALYRNPAAREAVPDSDASNRFIDQVAFQELVAAVRRDGVGRTITPVRTHKGLRWHEVTARTCRDVVTGHPAQLLTEVDVTGLKETEARARYLAHHDTLTGLPNRQFVLDTFQDTLSELGAGGRQAALIFIDLDRFKTINDALGHAAGDALLVQMASRLRGIVREADFVARLGGDEFLLLAPINHPEHDLDLLINRLRSRLSVAVQLHQGEVTVTPSMGVSLFPQDGDDIDTLMRHADLAMYQVKESGRNGVAHFTPEIGAVAQNRLRTESDLRNAVRRGEFEVHFQPRLDTMTERVIGAEALVRWRHPERGLLQPAQFIPICEEAGLMQQLSAFVFREAATRRTAWAARGLPISISVNLSSRDFSDPQLIARLHDIIRSTGCDPHGIELEITESVLLGNDRRTIESLEEMGRTGFRIAIDDFGTGYSNLSYLQRYPIHTLKIDRSFVQGIGSSSPLTEMIISLSKMLGLRMVAEGVEETQQLEWLRAREVHEFQGFLFSPPLSADHFETLLTSVQSKNLHSTAAMHRARIGSAHL